MKKILAFLILAACLVGSVEAADLNVRGSLALSTYPYAEAAHIAGHLRSEPGMATRGGLILAFPYWMYCYMRQASSFIVTPGESATTVTVSGTATCQDQNTPPTELQISLVSQLSTDNSALISADLVMVAPDGERAELALVPVQQLWRVKP